MISLTGNGWVAVVVMVALLIVFAWAIMHTLKLNDDWEEYVDEVVKDVDEYMNGLNKKDDE